MAVQVIIHIANEDPVVAELEKLPSLTDTVVTALNPRKRDGKDLPYLAQDVTTVIWPISRITFIEVVPTAAEEKIVGFVRE